jgi:hypothetical protein
MNRVMIYLDAGKMTLTDPNGKVETLNFKAGERYGVQREDFTPV